MMTATRTVQAIGDLRGRRALVLGLARSGVAAARFLADAGAEVAVYDRRPASELTDAVAALGARPLRLALGASASEVRELLGAAQLVVTSPSISTHFPTTDAWLRDALREAQARGADVASEVGLFLRLTAARTAAVTGTKGKTTTASLLAAMLAAGEVPHRLGGNIGQPLIEEAGRLARDDWAVLELSELQLPTIDRGTEVAVYTNITADHLDRHGSLEAYRAVKGRLAELSTTGSVVLNADDEGCRELAPRAAGEIHWYGLDDAALEANAAAGAIAIRGERLLPVDEVPLPGRHMLANVLAAGLAATLMGLAPNAIAAAVRGFRGVPHRLETIAERHGLRYVNDSQATIPAAAIAALDAFADRPVVLIAGGKDKGLDYREFAAAIARRCRAAVLIGETADRLARLLEGHVPVLRAGDMAEAVQAATTAAQPGDVVLLAPAAASFDMFVDYAARGDAFRAAVEGLA